MCREISGLGPPNMTSRLANFPRVQFPLQAHTCIFLWLTCIYAAHDTINFSIRTIGTKAGYPRSSGRGIYATYLYS